MEFVNLAFGQGDQFDARKRKLLVEAGNVFLVST